MSEVSGVVTQQTLQDFTDAWNAHDIDKLMSFMTPDCVFTGSAGPDVCGSMFIGFDDVRAAYQKVWEVFPDASWKNGNHFVDGDRGASEWTFEGTMVDGSRVVANGCDMFTFRGDKIHVKDSFRKSVVK